MKTFAKRLVIFEDHSLMRDGIRTWFDTNTDWTVIHYAGTIEEAENLIELLSQEATAEAPVVALVDISFKCVQVGGSSHQEKHYGFDIVRSLKKSSPYTWCIMYSSYSAGSFVDRALSDEIGARGYVTKNADEKELLKAVEAVANGGTYIEGNLMSNMMETRGLMSILTKRERDIVSQLVHGHSSEVISEKLGLNKRTIENHLSHMYDKTGTCSRVELLNRLGL